MWVQSIGDCGDADRIANVSKQDDCRAALVSVNVTLRGDRTTPRGKMSGEPILITLETASGAPSTFPVVLKKIMEMPPPNILDCDDGKCSKLTERKLRTMRALSELNRKKKPRTREQMV